MSELRILLVGKIVEGETHWDISPLPEQLEPLQAYYVAYGDRFTSEEAQDDTFLEVMQYHEDLDFDRRGGWL